MGQFIEIFKKVNGKKVLKEYRKAHVLLFSLAETAMLGFSKKSLEIVRLAVNNRIYQKLKKDNQLFITDYISRHKGEIVEHKHADIVWTSWLQGMDTAPAIVLKCYESMKNCIQDKEIIVITDNNYADYVQFPNFILNKYKNGIISKVQFSDLLRIELLANYGGTWLDSTVFCSGMTKEKHDYIMNSDLFLYQCLKPGVDGHCSSISSWFISGSSRHPIIMLTRALLHNYWKTHKFAVDYFILHYFFQMAIEAYPDEWKKVVPVSNAMPHVLLLRLFEQYDDKVWNTIREITPFHKLTYKFTQEQPKLEGTFYNRLINK